ncbi:sensor domain-containing diguanylate cyclase [Gluconobacter frateurii]|uniref:diguanylate cyclase n=1 Tax=Gluconobacter frateurii NRIC 0228 TaxID=1307946 RepID=A0ABQ0QEE8_9PROT|nr:GGDEF domain-containing protein [Gluconobacter frateurii]GBR15690.1 diguanylate cyclase [Gluconobacter frateurii NRIC 0228]GLP90376.1 diguanylate cyclase [Gluconobacter frateurii]
MFSRIAEKYLPALVVAGVVFFAAVIGIYSRHFGQLAQIWPANALLLWLMITYSRFARMSGWLGACAGYLLAGWVMGDTLLINVWLGAANLAGVCVGYVLFKALKGDSEGLIGPKSVLYLLLVCSGAAGASAAVGTGLSMPLPGSTAWSRFILWFSSELNRHLVLLPVCFAGREWFSRQRLPHWRSIFAIRNVNAAPVGSLAASVGLAAITGGPGAIAFPVPALLWCALSYTVLPLCLIVLVFNATVMGMVEAGLLNFDQMNQRTGVIVSFRLGLSFLVLGPLTVTAIMTTQRALVERLNQSVTWDSLTKVLSRQAYLERSLSLIAKDVPRSGSGIAILMLDIDHFKRINDTYGHFIGDNALMAVADAMSSILAEGQICGRLGGEEFALTISARTPEEATCLAEQIRLAVEKISIPLNENTFIQMTVSIGVAFQRLTKNLKLRVLLAQADAALYLAKANGRNRIELSSTVSGQRSVNAAPPL